MARVVGYMRLSKEENGNASIRTQEHSIREWANREGHEIVALHRDEGISGSVPPMKRPGAAKAIKEAKARGCGVLVVSKLDRISRDLKDVLNLVDDVMQHKATLVSISESFDASTPSGRMFLQLLSSFSEFERNRIRERTREALATRRREGRRTGGDVPFGWRVAGDRLVPVASEQRILNRAIELHRSGLSWAKVVGTLNREKANPRGWDRVRCFRVCRAEERRRRDMGL